MHLAMGIRIVLTAFTVIDISFTRLCTLISSHFHEIFHFSVQVHVANFNIFCTFSSVSLVSCEFASLQQASI